MGMATPPFDDILAGVKTAAKNWFFTAPHEIGYSFIFSYGFALDEPIPRKPELSINDDERLKCDESPSNSIKARLEPYTSLAVGGTAPRHK